MRAPAGRVQGQLGGQTIVRAVVRMLASSPHKTPPAALFFNDRYVVDLPKTSSFPMLKYSLIRRALQQELRHQPVTFTESPLVSLEDLHTTHTESYVRRYLRNELTALENRRIGFPWSLQSVNRSLSSTGGTVAAMHAICGNAPSEVPMPRFAAHIAGGTHHAFADRGEGFCVFSDIGVAASVALRDYPERVRRVLIVDLDGEMHASAVQLLSARVCLCLHAPTFVSPLLSSTQFTKEMAMQFCLPRMSAS